ncbi:MAG: LPS export ABC transporter periplasmic protein LptC [Gallionella sp.]
MTFASRTRYWLPLLPLLGLLGVTYWLDQQVRPEPAKADVVQRHDPDAVMENFSAIKMDEQGSPRFIMAAAKMQHYPDDDSATLDAPRLTSLSVEHPAIHVVARRGVVSGSGDEIFLHDDVEVLREASAGRGELTLQTDYLRIVPERDLADTDHAVAIFDGRNTIHAVGLEMDSRARTLKLLSQVRSVHEPR